MKEELHRSDSTGWGHFYANSGDEGYYDRHISIHTPILNAIRKSNPTKLLEAGCGSGIMSTYFSKIGKQCTALDNDPTVLEKASKSAVALGGTVNFVLGDIFKLEFESNSFDAVFSQGVLEHFDDQDIRRAAEEQLRVARIVWISVPSFYYKHRDFGNERLLKDREWMRILEPLGKVRTNYYYYQRVKRNFMIKRPLMLMIQLERS